MHIIRPAQTNKNGSVRTRFNKTGNNNNNRRTENLFRGRGS